MTETVIEIKGLGKKYRIGKSVKRADTFAQAVIGILKAPFENFRAIRNLGRLEDDVDSTFWALQDVSFNVTRGEVVGVIGHNGAGKSTLLKILSRITDPTEGEVIIHGRVSSLLEVGTGFHQELTGRDNIYMNGTILGMTWSEIDSKFDEIVAFSGIDRYIDTPVKFYSSGMKVRLGFSVAAHLDPEILIIDEVLAVGDVEFQRKCLGKIHSVAESGRTVIFVSHHMPSIKNLCSRCISLNHGVVEFDGEVSKAIDHYLSHGLKVHELGVIPLDFPRDYGTFEAKFTRVVMINRKNEIHRDFLFTEDVKVRAEFTVFKSIPNYVMSVMVGTLDGERIVYSEITSENDNKGYPKEFSEGNYSVELDIHNKLLPGSYSLYLGFAFMNGKTIDWLERIYDFQVLKTGVEANGHYRWDESHGFVLNETAWKVEKI